MGRGRKIVGGEGGEIHSARASHKRVDPCSAILADSVQEWCDQAVSALEPDLDRQPDVVIDDVRFHVR